MLQWDYYLLRVRSMLGSKATLTSQDEAHIRESYDCGDPPEFAADALVLDWLTFDRPANPTTAGQEP